MLSEYELAKELKVNRKTVQAWRYKGWITPKETKRFDSGAIRYRYDLEEVRKAVQKSSRH